MIEPASQGVLGTLGINGKLFLAQLVNFSIVIFVMWKYVYTPLLAAMDKRSKEIAEGLKNAGQAKKNLEDAEADRERIAQEARKAAHATMEEAQTKAETLRQERLEQLKTETEKITVENKERVANERNAAFAALKSDVAYLVTQATSKVVEGLDADTQRKLVAKAIEEIKNA